MFGPAPVKDSRTRLQPHLKDRINYAVIKNGGLSDVCVKRGGNIFEF